MTPSSSSVLRWRSCWISTASGNLSTHADEVEVVEGEEEEEDDEEGGVADGALIRAESRERTASRPSAPTSGGGERLGDRRESVATRATEWQDSFHQHLDTSALTRYRMHCLGGHVISEVRL